MLNRRIAVYIPSTVKGNILADQSKVDVWIKAAKVKLAKLFGGFTATKGEGGWFSPVHGLIEEPVTIVAAHTDDNGINAHAQDVREFALQVCLALEQEAVSVQIDNSLEFISAEPAIEVKAI